MRSPTLLPSASPQKLGLDFDRLRRLHRGVESFVETGRHAGVGLLLVRQGHTADFFAAGHQNVELGLPITRETIFRVYSMTKIIVSVAALTLLEEGELGLLDLVGAYLPDFFDLRVFAGGTAHEPVLVPLVRPVTIQNLFTHTSGFVYETPGEPLSELYRSQIGEQRTSLEQLVRCLARVPLKWQPGTRFEYGYSTDILARIVEVVTGRRIDEFLRERIFEPLEMLDTGYSLDADRKLRLSKVYEHGPDGTLRPVQALRGESVEGERDFPAGGGGLFSTLDDYAKFAQMLCNAGELAGVRILSRKTMELMVTNHLTITSNPFRDLGLGHGFGLGVGVRLGPALAGTLGSTGSFGWTGMATTYCRIDPAEKLVALIFAQHLPFDEHGLFERFANLTYQALV